MQETRLEGGGGNGNPLQYSCVGNPMDKGAWRTTVHVFAKSQTRLSTDVVVAIKITGSPLTLLVGMQTSTATMENSVEIP